MNANVFAPGCGVSRPAVRLKPLTFLILLSLFSAAVQAEDITEFNTEVLDLNERGDIDLSQFSQAGYVMPGTYSLALKINNSMLAERQIRFLAPDNDPQGSMACITPDMSEELGLTSSALRPVWGSASSNYPVMNGGKAGLMSACWSGQQIF